MTTHNVSELELYDFDLNDLDVEELERRLEFAPWDPEPEPEPETIFYCEYTSDGRYICSTQSSWPS